MKFRYQSLKISTGTGRVVDTIPKDLGRSHKLMIKQKKQIKDKYRQTSNMRCTFIGNKIVDHPDIVGASPVGAAPTESSFSIYITPGLNGLVKDNCKTRHI